MLKQCKRCYCTKHIKGKKMICVRCEKEFDLEINKKVKELGI